VLSGPVEAEGLQETIAALTATQDKWARRETNGRLRKAATTAAQGLRADLRAAAAGGPPVAHRVAQSIRVKNDRTPSVSIGGSRKVGARGAPASVLVWGSEHGGKNFAAGPSSGYWIKPTVERFGQSKALEVFKQAVVDIFQEAKLL